MFLHCRLDKIQRVAVRNVDDCVAVLERLDNTANEALRTFGGVVHCYQAVGTRWLGHCGGLNVTQGEIRE